jgi:hypothetical protein
MSELSIAELASENAELLPHRETLSTIIIKSSSIAIAHDRSIAVSVDKVNIVGSFDSHTNVIWLQHHHGHHMPSGPA